MKEEKEIIEDMLVKAEKESKIIETILVDLTMPHVNTFFYKMISDLISSGKEKTEVLKFFKDTKIYEKVKESLDYTDLVIDEGLEALGILRFLIKKGLDEGIFKVCHYRDKTIIKIK